MQRTRIDDMQRRARLVARHHLGKRADDVPAAVRALVALHSSDPISPFLALRARTSDFTIDALEDALYDDRTLWRLHAMRRTLFVVRADEAAVFQVAASQDVAASERRRVRRWVAAERGEGDVDGWLREVERNVLDVLRDAGTMTTRELASAVPELETEITLGSGKWARRSTLASRLLVLMAMDGTIVRSRPSGTWRSSQYRWADASSWFQDTPAALDAEQARAELTRRYLYSYGPATLDDMRWWTGWTVRRARRALEDVAAVTVDLDSGDDGYVLPEDLAPVDVDVRHVSLLPGLDPTPMGWKQRNWYLGPDASALFDGNGNVGPTVWVDGAVAGGWGQRPNGDVAFRLLRDVGADAARRVAEAADALAKWMGGTVATPRFRSPVERELSA